MISLVDGTVRGTLCRTLLSLPPLIFPVLRLNLLKIPEVGRESIANLDLEATQLEPHGSLLHQLEIAAGKNSVR
jgi:hypothetical protein